MPTDLHSESAFPKLLRPIPSVHTRLALLKRAQAECSKYQHTKPLRSGRVQKPHQILAISDCIKPGVPEAGNGKTEGNERRGWSPWLARLGQRDIVAANFDRQGHETWERGIRSNLRTAKGSRGRRPCPGCPGLILANVALIRRGDMRDCGGGLTVVCTKACEAESLPGSRFEVLVRKGERNGNTDPEAA